MALRWILGMRIGPKLFSCSLRARIVRRPSAIPGSSSMWDGNKTSWVEQKPERSATTLKNVKWAKTSARGGIYPSTFQPVKHILWKAGAEMYGASLGLGEFGSSNAE